MFDIEIQNIGKTFSGYKVLKDISFGAKSGEFIYLLGPSGCGKTTTLRIIAGLEQQDKGKVFVRGEEVSNFPAHKRGVGFIFQNYALFPHMTVRENIEFGLKMNSVPKKDFENKVKNILSLVGLDGFEDRKPNNLSGGEKQRISICRALVINPKILLMDEPLANLDAKLKKDMRIELNNLQKKIGITTICVTHDQEEAISTADRIVLMYKGQIEQIGKPYEIYEKPNTEFVADFMGQVNCYKGKVIKKEGGDITINSEYTPDIKATLPPEENYGEGEEVFFVIRKEKINILPDKNKNFSSNSFVVKIQSVIYLGSYSECIGIFKGKKGRITFHLSSNSYNYLPGKGDEVRAEWQPLDVFLIKKDVGKEAEL